MEQAIVRRIAGTAAAVLLIAVSWLGLDYAFKPPAGSYEVQAILGRAGSGLNEGTVVKLRGIQVGEVASIRYENAQAEATLRFDPGVQIPETGLEMVVTAKTLLGEKQVTLSFPDESFGQPPFLEPGDTIVADRQPTELQEAVDALEPFLDAIDPQEIATLIDVLGQQEGEGPNIRRNLELSAQVADFARRTADQTLDNARRLTSIADQLAPAAGEFDRLNRNLPTAVALIHERTGDISSNLDVLTSFAGTLTTYLNVEEDRIRRTLATGDVVGAFFERNADDIGSFVEGTGIYFQNLGRPADILSDGTTWGPFKIFLDLSQLGLPIGSDQPLDLSGLTQGAGGDTTSDGGPTDG